MPSGKGKKQAVDACAELVARGWMSVSGLGLIRCAGPLAALCGYFDAGFAALARRRRAQLHCFPGMISRQLLERLEYFSSFPGVATSAGEGYVLPPAVCYHGYELLEDRALEIHPFRITAVGRCCRDEGPRMTRSPERLRDFTMREIVFFGSEAEVAGERKSLMRSAEALLRNAGMEGVFAPATDPFFLGESRGKLLVQRLKELKHELRAPIRPGADLAIASFNHHEDFFTRRMNIGLADGARATSGCAAFGIERWAFAFVCQNGLDMDAWPDSVRRFVVRHAAC